MDGLYADLILENANIATLDEEESFVSASAARDGRIVATGAQRSMQAFEGPTTRVIDLGGRTVIPGIVDSHCHPDGYAARVSR
jgi:predicted amidohydrolase YtcJ